MDQPIEIGVGNGRTRHELVHDAPFRLNVAEQRLLTANTHHCDSHARSLYADPGVDHKSARTSSCSKLMVAESAAQ
eukprot:1220529-Rhodomonas_salina.1